jgi:hypothetical protein
MNSQTPTEKQWLLASIISGSVAAVTYLVSVLVSLPSLQASYLVFMLFGPCFSCAMYGLYKYHRVSHDSVPLQLGVLMLVLAGAINTIMAAMQGALRIYFENLPHDPEVISESKLAAWKMGLHSGNSLQMGVDVAWDYFVLIGMILLGVAIVGHEKFGRWFGWSAIALGAAGMFFNGWTFPDPPGAEGLLDVGPLCGAWFAILVIRMIMIYRKMGGSAEDHTTCSVPADAQ